MNIGKLKQILSDNNLLISEKSNNFICKCCYCGDHKNVNKQGHLYVSKKVESPLFHCFLCGSAGTISKLLKDISGGAISINEIYTDEEIQNFNTKRYTPKVNKRTIQYKVPKLYDSEFPLKTLYVRGRVYGQTVENIPNLVFDFFEFCHQNKIQIGDNGEPINNYEIDLLQNEFVGFLSKHSTTLYCRSINPKTTYKFRKIVLQKDSLSFLDYYSVDHFINGKYIVLAEGNFNILHERELDSLQLKDNIRLYASGNSFVYSSLLKSVAFDYGLYKTDIIILGDDDKKRYHYNKFLRENNHIINSCKIYINKYGKDFGEGRIEPVELL